MDELPDLYLEEEEEVERGGAWWLVERRVEDARCVVDLDSTCSDLANKEEFAWPLFRFSWRDFLPDQLAKIYLAVARRPLPSLLEVVDDVSESLPNGASEFWFNYVFAWWFTVPLEPVEEVAPTAKNKVLPCTKCNQLFQHDWEVSRHYIETHLPPAPPKPAAPPPKDPTPPPPPPPPKEDTPELLVDPPPWWEEVVWTWEDFLPFWDLPFLPTPIRHRWNSLSIEQEEETPPPPSPSPPPPPPPPRVPSPPPVIKQTKYLCKTCNLTICNRCFSTKCSAHNVDFRGTGTFGCGAC